MKLKNNTGAALREGILFVLVVGVAIMVTLQHVSVPKGDRQGASISLSDTTVVSKQ